MATSDQAHARHESHDDPDWLIVGSGFGGSVCALRLAQKGYSVEVLEQGKRFADGDFAKSAWHLRRYMWLPALGLRGIMRRVVFKHATVLCGVGVGGGSLVYANTLYVPHSDDFFKHPQWVDLADWRAALAPHYEVAQRMLGVTQYEGDGPSEAIMSGVAEDLGVPESVRPTPVGVYFGKPGETVTDPYFDGSGPDRTGCVRCGQCMLGCRFGAKNTLVKNYLWLAERLGVTVRAERCVTDIRPRDDGGEGYVVTSARPGAWLRRRPMKHHARGVILAGGTLGTNELLIRCKNSGSLPGLSPRLGELVRTNSEAVTAATSLNRDADYGHSVAITRSVYPDAQTHFTNNTFGSGGDALATTYGPLVDGDRRLPRPVQFALALARHPLRWLRHFFFPRNWSRRSILFTVMQSAEGSIALRPGRGGRLRSEASTEAPPHSWLPVANEITELAARRMGGYAQGAVSESLKGSPTSAHFLGGAVIGSDPENGVVDRYRRVFGYDNLLVCDGSSIPANLGVNPSLTITAMAEEAMTHIPDKAAQQEQAGVTEGDRW